MSGAKSRSLIRSAAGQELAAAWRSRRSSGSGARRSPCKARNSPSWRSNSRPANSVGSRPRTPDYGHEGPSWSAFFYEKGGGSMPDLAVYNLTSLTGLLGPAKHVTAMVNIVTPERTVERQGPDQSDRGRQRHGVDRPRQRRHLARAVGLQLLQPARPRRQQGNAPHDHHRRLAWLHGPGRLRLGAARRRFRDEGWAEDSSGTRRRRGLHLATRGGARRGVPCDRQGVARDAGARVARPRRSSPPRANPRPRVAGSGFSPPFGGRS